jgi:hypothetical protein
MLWALLASHGSAILTTGISGETGLAALDAAVLVQVRATEAYGLWHGMAAVWKRKPA